MLIDKRKQHRRVRILAATLQVEVNPVHMRLLYFLSGGFGEFDTGLLIILKSVFCG